MTITDRDRRALVLLGAAAVLAMLVRFLLPDSSVPAASVASDNVDMAQRRVARLRQIAGTVPVREAMMKQTDADLNTRESGGILQADTAAQAQASLLEIARRVGKGNQIDVRGGDLGAPKVFGDYGLVYATITFDCHIEQLVNFLADLSKQPELIAPSEERVVAANAKEKLVNVRMVLAGVVLKKLVPEKKALGAF